MTAGQKNHVRAVKLSLMTQCFEGLVWGSEPFTWASNATPPSSFGLVRQDKPWNTSYSYESKHLLSFNFEEIKNLAIVTSRLFR